MAHILLSALAYMAVISSCRVTKGGQRNVITNLDNTSLQWEWISLNNALSFLDWGIMAWIRDSREDDEALADID
jgi:hypothetical protein